jgi:hypothetical protein
MTEKLSDRPKGIMKMENEMNMNSFYIRKSKNLEAQRTEAPVNIALLTPNLSIKKPLIRKP